MAIVQTVDFSDLVQAFEVRGRADQFSRTALRALFDYYEELSEDSGEPFELDVIGLCVDWSEDTPINIASNYSIDISECEDDDDIKETVMDYLSEETTYIDLPNGDILYVNF